jgi:hypothetical protein
MVRGAVGQAPTQTIYKLYREVLCSAAPWFETELNKNELFVDNKDQNDQLVVVDFTTTLIFGYFQKWLFGKQVWGDKKDMPAQELVDLWILAARFKAPELQNIAIRGLVGKDFCLLPEQFKCLYQNTVPGSPLRCLFVQARLVRGMKPAALLEFLEAHWDELPGEMVKEIMVAQKNALHEAYSKAPRIPLVVQQFLVQE